MFSRGWVGMGIARGKLARGLTQAGTRHATRLGHHAGPPMGGKGGPFVFGLVYIIGVH